MAAPYAPPAPAVAPSSRPQQAAPHRRRRFDWDVDDDDEDEELGLPLHVGGAPLEAPKLTRALLGQGPEQKASSEDQGEHASQTFQDSSSTTSPPSIEEVPPPQPRSPRRRPAAPGSPQEHSAHGGRGGDGHTPDRGYGRRQRGSDESWEAHRGGGMRKKGMNGNGAANLVWRPKGSPAVASA